MKNIASFQASLLSSLAPGTENSPALVIEVSESAEQNQLTPPPGFHAKQKYLCVYNPYAYE
jgi:hypothetical protein